jgi:hypothetical protein
MKALLPVCCHTQLHTLTSAANFLSNFQPYPRLDPTVCDLAEKVRGSGGWGKVAVETFQHYGIRWRIPARHTVFART